MITLSGALKPRSSHNSYASVFIPLQEKCLPGVADDGERFFHQVQEAIGMLDSAAENLVLGDADLKGLVRVNAPVALGRLHIAPILGHLQAEYPKLVIELTLTDALVDLVQEGADIAVRVGRMMMLRYVPCPLPRLRFCNRCHPGR